MKRIAKSVGFALSGFKHAVKTERNIQQFLGGLLVYCIVGLLLGYWIDEWVIVFMASTFFLMMELLNTAIERLADVVDDQEKKKNGGHYHQGIKQAKDVAAAASLFAFLMVGILLVLILSAHIAPYFLS